MATKPTTKTKPEAAKKQPVAKKPVAKVEKPAAKVVGVGIKELAADLNRSPKSVRASIRRALGGKQVGQGGRYNWASKNDKQYKELVNLLTAPKVTETKE